MNILKKLVFFIGRACFSVIFILAGAQKIFNWAAVEQGLVNALCEWMGAFQRMGWSHQFIDILISWAPLLMVFCIVFEVIGGILLFLGVRVRLASFLLILVLVSATLLFHNFWMMEGDQVALQMVMFLKNLSIFGGLLVFLVIGDYFKSQKKSSPSPEK